MELRRKRHWARHLAAALLPLLAARIAAASPTRGLPYTTTNAEAGAPARYGLLLPAVAETLWTPGEPWTLVFDAALDVAAYQRRLQLCYARDRSGHLPAHSRCVEPIPATHRIRTGPVEDRVTITPSQAFEAKRPLGVWLDLMNPMAPGTYEVQLLQGGEAPGPIPEPPLARWELRVEQPGAEGPGSGD